MATTIENETKTTTPTHLVLIQQENYGERYASLYVGLFSSEQAARDYIANDEDLANDVNVVVLPITGAIDG